MISREQAELEKRRTDEINHLFELTRARINVPSALFEQAAFEAERIRLISIVNSKYGSELYDANLLRLNEKISETNSVEQLKKHIDIYLDAVNYYQTNYDNLKWVIDHKKQVKKRLSTGKLDNWEALLKHDIVRMRHMSSEQSTVFVMDVLTHMQAEAMEEKQREQVVKAMARKENTDKEENNKIQREAEISAAQVRHTVIALQQEVKQDREEVVKQKIQEQVKEEKSKDEILIEEEIKLENVEDHAIDKVAAETDKQDESKRAEAAAQLKNAEIKQIILQEKLVSEKHRQEAIEKQRQEKCDQKLAEVFNLVFRYIHNHNFWTQFVSATGNAPKVPWLHDEKGQPIKVPTGIYKMMKIFRRPNSHMMTMDVMKKIMVEIASIAKERIQDTGFFSTRRGPVNTFYDICKDLTALLDAVAGYPIDFQAKADTIMGNLLQFSKTSENAVTNTPKIMNN